MDSRQKNRDLRTQTSMPFIAHNVKRVKPGKDFFSANFFTLLLILCFNLFFYKSYATPAGDSPSTMGATALTNMQRFQIP